MPHSVIFELENSWKVKELFSLSAVKFQLPQNRTETDRSRPVWNRNNTIWFL